MKTLTARKKWHAVATSRWIALAGFSFFATSLPLYLSYQNRPVAGRYSYVFAALMGLVACVWLWLIWWSYRGARRRPPTSAVPVLLYWALLLWGVAYFLTSLASRSSAGRILDLNLYGSTLPAAAMLEWLSLSMLFLAAAVGLGQTLNKSPASVVNLALVSSSIIGLAIAGEGLARVKAIGWPQTQGFPTYSSALWFRRYSHVNSLGFRDREPPKGEAESARRMLLVGDSFAFGVGVRNPSDRFGEQLAGLLSENTEQTWKTINAGKRDSHTLQHLELLQNMLYLRPDLVVLLYVFNDIDYLGAEDRRGVSEAPRGITDRAQVKRLLFQNSYLFQELYVRLRLVKLHSNEQPQAASVAGLYGDTIILDRHLGDLARFVALAEESGAAAVLVPFDIGVAAGDGVERYLLFEEALKSSGLPYCSLLDAFRGSEYSTLRVNRLDGHPNARAHTLAAEEAWRCVACASASPPRTSCLDG